MKRRASAIGRGMIPLSLLAASACAAAPPPPLPPTRDRNVQCTQLAPNETFEDQVLCEENKHPFPD